jgi:hypothetical protein
MFKSSENKKLQTTKAQAPILETHLQALKIYQINTTNMKNPA